MNGLLETVGNGVVMAVLIWVIWAVYTHRLLPVHKARCPHSNCRGIYGDEANHTPTRLHCTDCGAWLDGGPMIALTRQGETTMHYYGDGHDHSDVPIEHSAECNTRYYGNGQYGACTCRDSGTPRDEGR